MIMSRAAAGRLVLPKIPPPPNEFFTFMVSIRLKEGKVWKVW
jgi:hypothetical protein